MNSPARSAYLVLAALALVVLLPSAGLISISQLPGFESQDLAFWESRYIRRVIFFSVWQALLSTIISVTIAIAVARAFAHRGNFAYRNLILKLFGLPLVIPAVVAVMGIVSVYGSNGWIPLGQSLYGLPGILLAHVFFNFPLSVRLLLPTWQGIPYQQWQVSSQLGLSQWQQWRYLEWPALRETLPGVALLVFMLCLTSFAVVLTLGGGPRSTTLEVAIFQSLRFDFDPSRAVVLALLQLSLCAIVAWASHKFQALPEVEITLAIQRFSTGLSRSVWHIVLISSATVFICLPLFSMIIDAVSGPLISVLTNPALWRSAAFSLIIGLSAATISVIAGWLLLRTSSDLAVAGKTHRASLIELAGSMVFVVPPLVIGTGFFVLIAPHFNVFNWAIPIVILINSMMGLPFVIRTLGPAMRQSKARYQRLCLSLALSGWNRFKWVDWPLLRQSTGLAAALVCALAMGDLGVIALFGTPETTTLPLMLYHQLSAYLIANAAVTALFLLASCLLVFWLLETVIGGKRHAAD